MKHCMSLQSDLRTAYARYHRSEHVQIPGLVLQGHHRYPRAHFAQFHELAPFGGKPGVGTQTSSREVVVASLVVYAATPVVVMLAFSVVVTVVTTVVVVVLVVVDVLVEVVVVVVVVMLVVVV